MPIPFMAIGAGLGALNSLGRFFLGNKQNNLANQINPVYKERQISPYAQQNLGITQQMFGARMPGAAEAARNIAANQASQMSNITRNATDSSQALALGAATQGATNQAYTNLGIQEGQMKYGLLDNLNNAYGQMTQELDKQQQDMLRKYGLDLEAKSGLRASGAANQYGALSDLSSLGIMLGQYAGMGGNKPNQTGGFNLPQGYLNTGG